MSSIAIFNSFPFHYEVFGYILHFAKQNTYHVDIYTNTVNHLGWFDFYSTLFDNFTINNYTEYNCENGYSHIFVTTDDDPHFKNEWINDRVICINHYYRIRKDSYKRFINIANFKDSELDFSIACYPVVHLSDKLQNNVVTIVGCRNGINIETLERIRSFDGKPVTFNILGRNVDLPLIKGNFIVNCKKNVSTLEMFKILKESSYILMNVDFNKDHQSGKSSSGSLPLVFNCLCKPILSCNKIHQFSECVEYSESFTKPIVLTPVDFNELSSQRDYYIAKFEGLVSKGSSIVQRTELPLVIPKNIFQTWKTKSLSPAFQKIVNTWIHFNPEWKYQLYSDQECDIFIKENFDESVYNTYKKIVPGAYKADLWRYCVLYKYGGVYIDIDTICMSKISDFIHHSHFVTPVDLNTNPREGTHNLFNTFIASVPESPILLDCIHQIVYNVTNNIIPQSKLDFTGPGILGRAVNKYLGRSETSSFVGKEHSIDNGVLLLKFEQGTEYVKNKNGDILFQNKNGNKNIQMIYDQECQTNKIIPWVTCQNPIN